MSIKTTRYISRATAIDILMREVPLLPNDTLGDLMDVLADSEHSHAASRFDLLSAFDLRISASLLIRDRSILPHLVTPLSNVIIRGQELVVRFVQLPLQCRVQFSL